MSTDLIIDGYNVMHLAGLARKAIGAGDLERARERLLRKLHSQLSTNERKRTTVVFDGTDQPASGSRWFKRFEMAVLFSPFGQEADDVIEELIRTHRDPRRLVVVSSDNRLKQAARSHRAGWLDADTFLCEIEHRSSATETETNSPQVSPARPPENLSETEVQRWISEFGEIDVSAIRRETASGMAAGATTPGKPTTESGIGRLRTSKRTPSAPIVGENRLGHQPRTPQGTVSDPNETRKEPQREPGAESPSRQQPFDDDPELEFWQQRVDELLKEQDGPEPPQK